MTIAFGTIGTKSTSIATATVDVPHPASPAAGDLLLAGRSMWLNTATPTDEAGWTAVGSLSGGTGTLDDSHTSVIRGDYKQAVGGESGNVTFDQGGTVGGVIGVMARYTKAANKSWFVGTTYATLGALEAAYVGRNMGQIETHIDGLWRFSKGYASGTANTHAANRSVTTENIHLQTGDMLIALAAVDTDAALTITANTFTATGITFGTVNRRTSGAGSTTGNDGNIELFDALVTAGTADVPVTFAFTTVTTQCGPVVIVRLREVDPLASLVSWPPPTPQRRVMTTLLVGA